MLCAVQSKKITLERERERQARHFICSMARVFKTNIV